MSRIIIILTCLQLSLSNGYYYPMMDASDLFTAFMRKLMIQQIPNEHLNYLTCEPSYSAPHEWNITRDMWLAQPFNHSSIAENMSPVMLVIIQHTVSSQCTVFSQCAAELRNMQSWYIAYQEYDIPYNFIIGNDGRVYEGRGWNIEGAHTFGYNRCSLGIGFIGDYREEIPNHARVTEAQLNRTRMLFEEGVRLGYLREDFQVVGAKDVRDTASPGSNLHNAIKQWDNFDHQKRFVNMNCEQIQDKYGDVDLRLRV